jgi:hypothetical protein
MMSSPDLKKAASPSHSIKNDETKNLIGATKNRGGESKLGFQQNY